MSQVNKENTTLAGFSARTVIVIVLLVGLGSATVFGVASSLAANTSQSTRISQLSTLNDQQSLGPRFGEGRWIASQNGTYTSFRAVSTLSNVTVNSFSITDSTHFTVSLSYTGTGSAPAVTIVGLARGLSGSSTLSAGWSSPRTVTISMVGTGSLSSNACVRALVVPYTGA